MRAEIPVQDAEKYFEWAVSAHQRGERSEAAQNYRKAIDLNPGHAEACNNLAILLEEEGKAGEAEMLYRRAMTLRPDYIDAFNNLGMLLAGTGNFNAAGRIYSHVIEANMANGTTFRQLAELFAQTGNLEDAETYFAEALEFRRDDHLALFGLGSVFETTGRLDDAERCMRQVLALQPGWADAHARLGSVLGRANRTGEAAQALREALKLDPNRPGTLCDLGLMLQSSSRAEEALACFHDALRLDPNCLPAHGNLGNLCMGAGQYDEAEQHFRRVLEMDAESVEAINNLGQLLEHTHRPEEAEACYRRVLELDPRRIPTQLNLSLSLLRDGRYAEGWPLYESRYIQSEFWGDEAPLRVKPKFSFKEWEGESLEGLSLLVWPEQGYGDSIQFARYFPLLKAKRLERLTVVCPRALVALFSRIDGVDACIAQEDARDVPQHDFWCFYMSLPFRMGTTLANVPASMPYLSAPPGLIERWGARLLEGPERPELPEPPEAPFRVGLVWAGDPRPQLNSAHETDQRRSLHASALLPLLRLPGITFVSLQKGESTQPQILDLPKDLRPFDCMSDVADFADTAAIITHLDLVVTVDTSVAHLAAALGKPVWILSRFDGCWRWLKDRDDSPWYPTVRLFRQTRPGDWNEVIERVAHALADVSAKVVAPESVAGKKPRAAASKSSPNRKRKT